MEECIGECTNCGKDIYCRHGFFEGVIKDNKELLCFECDESDHIAEQ